MPFDTKILSGKIEKIKESFQNGRFGDALVGALNTGNGLMQQRIFTQNEDVQGQSFGVYVGSKRKARLTSSKNKTTNKRLKAIEGQFLTSYQRKRAAAGRQVIKKDLEFHGGLRRSIETQIENEKAATLEFNNSEAAKIAKGQEVQITNIRNGGKGTTKGIGVKIFGLDTKEKEQVNEQAIALINQILKSK